MINAHQINSVRRAYPHSNNRGAACLGVQGTDQANERLFLDRD
jgi:hypothetical protein